MIIAKVSSLIMKGGHGQTNRLHDTNWNALGHAYASRIISFNYIWLLDTLYRIIEMASNFQQKVIMQVYVYENKMHMQFERFKICLQNLGKVWA